MLEDNVTRPKHYISESGLEAIDVIKAFVADLNGYEAYATGNIIKYILRWKHKNGIEDLRKADWYINNLVGYLVDTGSEEYDKEISKVYKSDGLSIGLVNNSPEKILEYRENSIVYNEE